ncbi:hypothetical protein MRX96_038745 [Rhipicephalus microplus]
MVRQVFSMRSGCDGRALQSVGHPPSVQTALNLSKMADMVMSKAQQASEEALKFQRFSEEALARAKVVEGVSDARLPPFELKKIRERHLIDVPKSGTHRATKDKGFLAAIRDECVHDNCGSYPAGPREIQQIIDEGVGKPKYTRDMKSGQMMSPRTPEIIYELSEQSLDIEVVPSERCKGTQSSLPFDGVLCKTYHRNQVIASTNDSANKEAPRSNVLDTLREDAKDKQARHQGMLKHSKHMREIRSLEGGKVAEKTRDSTGVRSSRRLSSTVQQTTNEDAQSTSRLHNIKASQKKRTHTGSHKSGSDSELKVLPSDTYVFMAATAAIAGGDAKNPKAATATGKGSKKMDKKAGYSENPKKIFQTF